MVGVTGDYLRLTAGGGQSARGLVEGDDTLKHVDDIEIGKFSQKDGAPLVVQDIMPWV